MAVQPEYSFKAIATINTCYKEKFGIPRQAGLITEAVSEVKLLEPYNNPATLKGLDEFSHIWLFFIFSENIDITWRAQVRPPRLGGNKKKGVFATRSPVRPNPIGLSVVKLIDIDYKNCTLLVTGADMLDNTPIVDIKPYVPYADSISDANGGFASERPETSMAVKFSETAETELKKLSSKEEFVKHKSIIEKVLALDPRPAYHDDYSNSRIYGIKLLDYDIKWTVAELTVSVVKIDKV